MRVAIRIPEPSRMLHERPRATACTLAKVRTRTASLGCDSVISLSRLADAWVYDNPFVRTYHSLNNVRPFVMEVEGEYPNNFLAFETSAKVISTSPGCISIGWITAFFPITRS